MVLTEIGPFFDKDFFFTIDFFPPTPLFSPLDETKKIGARDLSSLPTIFPHRFLSYFLIAFPFQKAAAYNLVISDFPLLTALCEGRDRLSDDSSELPITGPI